VSDDDTRTLVTELRGLRGRRGMRPGRAATECPGLVAKLGIQPDELHTKIVTTLRGMGEGRDVRALINAYGFDMVDPGETTKERRISFAASLDGQSPDTVETWENRAIDSLLAKLVQPQTPTEVHSLFVGMIVRAGRVIHYHERDLVKEASHYHNGRELRSKRITSTLSATGFRAVPFLIYRTPDELPPSCVELILTVSFVDQRVPRRAWAASGPDLYAVMSNNGQDPLYIEPGRSAGVALAKENQIIEIFENPLAGAYYALIWEPPSEQPMLRIVKPT
jgi:hypothetical protein